jgi:hypothetical protein
MMNYSQCHSCHIYVIPLAKANSFYIFLSSPFNSLADDPDDAAAAAAAMNVLVKRNIKE